MTPGGGEVRRRCLEILSGETGDEGDRIAARQRLPVADDLDRVDAGALELAGRRQLDVEDHAHGEVADGGEVSVVGEVAEAVGDEVALVKLHSAQHVRAARDHEAGAGVDGHVGESLRVAPVLAEEILLLTGHVVGVGTFGADVHVDDHDRGFQAGLLDQAAGGGEVEKIGVVGVGREGAEGDGDSTCVYQGDLARQPGLCHAGAMDRRHGLRLASRPEVERVVVGVVEDGEADLPQIAGVARGVTKGEAVGRPRRGLA